MNKATCHGTKPLVLIGLRGSGKSSVGRHLSGVTHMPFLDTDAMVEACTHKRVHEIFAEHGEDHFRGLEHEMIRQAMLGEESSIVATGGGAIVSKNNRELLWNHGWVVYLQAGVDVLLHRTSHDSTRPLLKTADPQSRLEELLAARSGWYEQADLICPVLGCSVAELAEKILQQLPPDINAAI